MMGVATDSVILNRIARRRLTVFAILQISSELVTQVYCESHLHMASPTL